jgi:hypothetical protein
VRTATTISRNSNKKPKCITSDLRCGTYLSCSGLRIPWRALLQLKSAHQMQSPANLAMRKQMLCERKQLGKILPMKPPQLPRSRSRSGVVRRPSENRAESIFFRDRKGREVNASNKSLIVGAAAFGFAILVFALLYTTSSEFRDLVRMFAHEKL